MSYYEKEFLQKLEEVTLEKIRRLDGMSIHDDKIGSVTQDVLDLTKVLNEAAQIDVKEREIMNRSENEKIRLENERIIETQKIDPSWKRIGFEMAKTLFPLIISVVGYGVFQTKVMKYEENGRICSTAGRELHLPKFWK